MGINLSLKFGFSRPIDTFEADNCIYLMDEVGSMDAVRTGSFLVSLSHSRSDISLSYQSLQTRSSDGKSSDAVQIDFQASMEEINATLASISAGTSATPLDSSAISRLGPAERVQYLSLVDLIGDDSAWMDRFTKGINELFSLLTGASGGAQPPTMSASPAPQAGQESGVSGSEGALQSAQGLLVGRYVSFSMEAHLSAVYAASAEGEVQIQSFELSLSMEQTSVEVAAAQQNMADPLVLDLDRDGAVSISGPQQGVWFDINGDGVKEQCSFVNGADGFLALDLNGDGEVSSGRELFGDQNGAENGFSELAKYDDNQDGLIDAADSVFGRLSVVTRGEDGSLVLHPLSEFGIRSIGLGWQSGHNSLGAAGYLNAFGAYQTNAGEKGLAADAMLSYLA